MIVSFKTSRAVFGLDIDRFGNLDRTGVDWEEFILTKNPEKVGAETEVGVNAGGIGEFVEDRSTEKSSSELLGNNISGFWSR